MRARLVLALLLVFAPAAAQAFCFGEFKVHVFNDANGNGVLDAGEAGRAGVVVQFDQQADGSVESTVTTDANGDAVTGALGIFPFRIRVVLPPGATQTTPNPGDQVVNCGAFGPSLIDFGLVQAVPATSHASLVLLAIALATVSLAVLRRG